MTEKRKGHGGARPGAGPKKKYEKGRRASASLMIYMTEEEKKKLDNKLIETGETKTTFVRRVISEAIER